MSFVWLFLCHIESADAESEPFEFYSPESCFLDDALHAFSLGKRFYGVGQVVVSVAVFGEYPSDSRNDEAGIKGVELLHGEAFWGGEFQYGQHSVGSQHAVDFGQCFVQVLEVADAERHGGRVEAPVLERQG